MKKTAFLLVLLLLLTGCQRDVPVADEKGGMLYLTGDEVGQYDLEGSEGYFVLNEDKTFTPLATTLYGYAGAGESSSPSRYLWYSDNSFSTTNLIPKVTSKSPLVVICNKEDALLGVVMLEKYDFKGATLGMHFYADSGENMYIITEDPLEGSSGEQVKGLNEEKKYKVYSVNGSESLPIANIDNNLEMLLGLEEDKYYNFEFFKGTKFLELEVKADTKVYQSSKMIRIDNPYIVTKEGYFIVNLPDNLEDGFYFIDQAGLFFYEKGGN